MFTNMDDQPLNDMMQRLGVSDRNSYPWSTPIWGHQFGLLPSIIPSSTVVKQSFPKKEEAKENKKEEEVEELHDCEADGNGKKKGKKRNQKSNPKRKNIPILIGCMVLKPKRKVNPRKRKPSHFESWVKENQRVNLFLL